MELIGGSVMIATHLGMSQLIIGLTIVAAATSLPEVVTSVMAAWHGERDIAVGKVLGSNPFNILCVLGLSSVIAPSGIEVSCSALRFDIPGRQRHSAVEHDGCAHRRARAGGFEPPLRSRPGPGPHRVDEKLPVHADLFIPPVQSDCVADFSWPGASERRAPQTVSA